jgi:hypothetical protein
MAISSHELRRVRKVAKLLDSQFEFRGIRFGIDPLLGLFPGVGDLVTSAMSFYLIHLAWQLQSPPILLLRMGFNVLVDNILDLIPFIGNLFDFIWKANERNLRLLENYLENPKRTKRVSYFVIILIGAALLAALILSFYLTFEVLMAIWNFFLTGTSSGNTL